MLSKIQPIIYFYSLCFYSVPCLALNVMDHPKGTISVFYDYKIGDLTPCLAEKNVIALHIAYRDCLVAAYARPADPGSMSLLAEELSGGWKCCIFTLPFLINAGNSDARFGQLNSNHTTVL